MSEYGIPNGLVKFRVLEAVSGDVLLFDYDASLTEREIAWLLYNKKKLEEKIEAFYEARRNIEEMQRYELYGSHGECMMEYWKDGDWLRREDVLDLLPPLPEISDQEGQS